MMYDRIVNTSLDVFDRDTGNYIGKARFVLPAESEKALLDLINFGKIPKQLVLIDVSLYNPSKSYVLPEAFQVYRRNSILNAALRDTDSGEQMPVEIRLKYDARVKAHPLGPLFYFDAVELFNLAVASIRAVRF